MTGLSADLSSLFSGWSGTLGHLSYLRAPPMATPGCGRSRMVTARPSRAPAAQPPVAESSLMVRAAPVSIPESFLECRGWTRRAMSLRLPPGPQLEISEPALSADVLSPRADSSPFPTLMWSPWLVLGAVSPHFLALSIPSLGVSECAVCPLFICASGPLGKRAVVGYEDGTIRIWDLKQGNPIHVLKGNKGGECHPGPL